MRTSSIRIVYGRLADQPGVDRFASSRLCNAVPNPHWQAILSQPVPVRKPSLRALLLGLLPFVGMCFSVALWDRIDPMILGLPFNLAWLLGWIVFTSLCLWAAYRVESAREKKDGGAP
jgi:hypothetical protein